MPPITSPSVAEATKAYNGKSNQSKDKDNCAYKPNTEVTVLLFPNNNFNAKELAHGMAKYYGLHQTEQYKPFDLIYCIQAERGTLQKIKPTPIYETETQA